MSRWRCGCTSEIPSECCYNNCDWSFQPAPIIILSEKGKSNTTFYVSRNIEHYPYTLQISYTVTEVDENLADEYGFYTRLNQIETGDYSVINGSNDSITATERINVSYTIPDDCYFNDWDNPECEYYIDANKVNQYPCSQSSSCTWCDFHDIPGPLVMISTKCW